MEWAAWAVKYGLSLYMLLAGGCIAYKLFNLSEAEAAITLRTGAATKAYNECVAAARTNRQRAACRQFAGDVQTNEATMHATRTNAARPAWMDRFTNHPLFNYLPGILAVLGAALLTLLSKLFPQRLDDDGFETAQTAPRLTVSTPRLQSGFAPAQASIPRPRRFVRPGPDAAARVGANSNAAPLDALATTLAKLGAVDPSDPPMHTVNPPTSEGSSPSDRPPEASSLPELPDIQLEHKRDGSIEAWHSPEGKRHRTSKTYLGRIGKRQLAVWQQLAPAEFREAVEAWVEQKRAEKL